MDGVGPQTPVSESLRARPARGGCELPRFGAGVHPSGRFAAEARDLSRVFDRLVKEAKVARITLHGRRRLHTPQPARTEPSGEPRSRFGPDGQEKAESTGGNQYPACRGTPASERPPIRQPTQDRGYGCGL